MQWREIMHAGAAPSCYSSRAASALLFPAPAASGRCCGSLLRFSKSSNFFEIHAKKTGRSSHACRGLCACVYSFPFAPRGLTFPSLQKFTFFLVLLLRSISVRPAGSGRRSLLSASPPESGPPVRARPCKSYARSAARMNGAGRAFLPRPGRAAAACCNNRHGRGVAAARRPPFPSTVPLSDPADPVIMLPLPPARDQSTRGGIYRPRNPFSLGSWRCNICMHADCREWCMRPSYSCSSMLHHHI